MATNITRWNPDTCDCVLEYEWDNELDENNRVHSFYNVIQQCEDHKGISQLQAVYDKVKDENTAKNNALIHILKNVPELVDDFVDDEGHTEKRFKKGKEPKWSFQGTDMSRQLHFDVSNLNLSDKVKLKTGIDSEFGINKIQLDG